MTPEQFAELIAQGNAEKIAEASACWSEAERHKVWRGLSKIVKKLSGADRSPQDTLPVSLASDVLAELRDHRFRRGYTAFDLAVLAVGPFSEAKKRGGWNPSELGAVVKVLSDRRPEWIDKWVESRLGARFPTRYDWDLIRPLIRHRICRKPSSDEYIRWMASAAINRWQDDPRLLSQIFLDDPDTLEDVWRLFEVDTWALWMPEDGQPMMMRDRWPVALAKLSDEGLIDRQRLLDASLKALSSGFKDTTLTYYIRFYRFLKPTPEETASRQQTFVELLSNPASHVVTFALEILDQIERIGRLNSEPFLSAMSAVFHLRSKVQSQTALRIAARLIEKEPKLLPHAVAGVLDALSHPASAVQQQSLDLIESWAPRLHPDHASAIRERLEELAPSVRPRAEKLIRQFHPTAAVSTEETVTEVSTSTLDELAREAGALPSPWRERAGVDDALESIRAGRMPKPLKFDVLEARVLTGVAPIEPIRTVDELIDTVAHAIETLDSADELERILDGISRLCDQRPVNYQSRTEPLAKRLAEHRLSNDFARQLADRMPESLYHLLMTWLSKETAPPGYSGYDTVQLYRFFDSRIEEVIGRVKVGRARPLLAAPTHEGGWISPVVLVQRLSALFSDDDEPDACDLIQALLRLAPDNREIALAEAGDVPGCVGRAVRWCLGSGEGPVQEDSSHTSLWLAAGRARCPTGSLDALSVLEIAEDQPDALQPARYEWTSRARESNSRLVWRHGYFPIEITVKPGSPHDASVRTWPTVALHEPGEHWKQIPAWQCRLPVAWRIGVAAQVWPLCHDPLLVAGIAALGWRVDMPESTLEPNHVYLRPWLEPDRPWSELATVAIWMALVSKDPGSRTSALDVLVESIADGRACPRQMSKVLVRMLPGGWVKLNRVADALAEAGRMSAVHAWFAAETLQGIVAGMDSYPREMHSLLSLLYELLADLGAVLSAEARCQLEDVPGTGKTKKIAVALRRLESRPDATQLQQAGLAMLESRIARARRWVGQSALT
jgi:hypothetical protein